jgi:hypothetical protein
MYVMLWQEPLRFDVIAHCSIKILTRLLHNFIGMPK